MKAKNLILGLVVVLSLALALPGAVLADNITEVTGNVVEGYTFTAPAAIGLGDMEPGQTATGESVGGQAGRLEGNHAAGYSVKAKDMNTSDTGRMTVGVNVLSQLLQISSDGTDYMTLDTEVAFFTTGAGPGSWDIPLHVKQVVTYEDPVATGYSITITFTVTENTP